MADLEDQFSSNDQTFDEQLETVREVGLRVFHVALIFILAPIIAFYLLVDLPHLRRVAESLVPERNRAEVQVVAHRLNRAIGGFFRGQLVVALIVGTMVSIGLAILGPAVLAARRDDRRDLQHDPAHRPVHRRRSRASSSPSPPATSARPSGSS